MVLGNASTLKFPLKWWRDGVTVTVLLSVLVRDPFDDVYGMCKEMT